MRWTLEVRLSTGIWRDMKGEREKTALNSSEYCMRSSAPEPRLRRVSTLISCPGRKVAEIYAETKYESISETATQTTNSASNVIPVEVKKILQ